MKFTSFLYLLLPRTYNFFTFHDNSVIFFFTIKKNTTLDNCLAAMCVKWFLCAPRRAKQNILRHYTYCHEVLHVSNPLVKWLWRVEYWYVKRTVTGTGLLFSRRASSEAARRPRANGGSFLAKYGVSNITYFIFRRDFNYCYSYWCDLWKNFDVYPQWCSLVWSLRKKGLRSSSRSFWEFQLHQRRRFRSPIEVQPPFSLRSFSNSIVGL